MGKSNFNSIYQAAKKENNSTTCKSSYFCDTYSSGEKYVGVVVYAKDGKFKWRTSDGFLSDQNGRSFYVIIKKGSDHEALLQNAYGADYSRDNIMCSGFTVNAGRLQFDSELNARNQKGEGGESDGSKYCSKPEEELIKYMFNNWKTKGSHQKYEFPSVVADNMGDPKKMCIILVVTKTRKGGKKEYERLTSLASSLGYGTVVAPRDPTAQEMVETLRDAGRRAGQYKSLLVFICCHGNEHGLLFGRNNRTCQLGELQKSVNAVNSKTFRMCPKLFVVNACRGGAVGETVTDGGTYVTDAPTLHVEGENFFISRSNIEGLVSYRDTTQGAHFIICVERVWNKYFKSERITDLMRMVRAEMRDRYPNSGQCPPDETTLYKKVIGGVFVN